MANGSAVDDHHHGVGHNHASESTAQWQTPHLPHDHKTEPGEHYLEPDLDLVESTFIEGFAATSDPTSFLRLAGIPFVAEADGRQLTLLRVEINDATDVGSLTPHLGGDGFRYAPLPVQLVGRRRSLTFAYHSNDGLARFSLADVRKLTNGADAAM